MKIIKKYKWLIVLVLVMSAGICFIFCHFYLNDVKALKEFSALYEIFDEAMTEYSLNRTHDLESIVEDAFIELDSKASFRISSLIKNDSELMDLIPEVARLSGKELDSLKFYTRSVREKNTDLAGLAEKYSTLSSQRKAAYARFLKLAGVKD
ncbi:MAG: hypothetical protein MUP98_13120 [Candidatus Aminicenantes bacterium]|nr:hypothetical protein [Candidatus Aminicenantes bacterium]